MSSNNQSQTLPEWMNELKDLLECPVCLKTFMDPPIFMCEKGHGLCGNCREDIKKKRQSCPLCRGALLDTRNLTVEQMLDKLPKNKCKYDGCQFQKVELDLVKKHEIDCLHRLVICGLCNKGNALLTLTDHLSSVHLSGPLDMELGVEHGFNGSKLSFGGNHQPLKCDSMDFYINQKYHSENLAMFWISFSGDQGEAEKYEYSLKIFSSFENATRPPYHPLNYLFTGSRQCVSCDVSQEDMKKEMSALFIDTKLLQRASSGDVEERVRYILMVKKR